MSTLEKLINKELPIKVHCNECIDGNSVVVVTEENIPISIIRCMGERVIDNIIVCSTSEDKDNLTSLIDVEVIKEQFLSEL